MLLVAGDVLVDVAANAFAVPHLAEDSAVRAANPFDCVKRAVGVAGRFHGGFAVQIDVLGANLPVFAHFRQICRARDKLAFAVRNGDCVDVADLGISQPRRFHAGNAGVHKHALVPPDVVKREGGACLGHVANFAVWQQAQLNQRLEAVADTEH